MASPDDKINAALAAVITGAYKEAGLTLPQLASKSGLSSTTVQRIAAGSVSIKVGDLASIADAVGIPATELFERALKRLEREGMSVPSATPKSPQEIAADMSVEDLENRDQVTLAAEDDPEERTDEPDASA